MRRTRSKSLVWQALAATIMILALATPLSASANLKDKPIHIVAYGDSLTAGYNLPKGDDFASQLEAALQRAGHNVRIANAGVSGDTTSGGVARFDWAIPEDAEAVILELGANDALRGISPAIARRNLETLIVKLKARNIPVLLAGMRALANWGTDYAGEFNAIYPELADKHDILLYPFFMEGVIDRPDLKLDDALHPNKQGVAEIVRRISPYAIELLGQVRPKK